MSSSPRIAVVGSGLAAEVVERALSEEGLDVRRFVDTGSDISSIWSGYGSAFGPAASPPPASAGSIEQRDRGDAGFTADRRERWNRLRQRRTGVHPYFRLDRTPSDVRDDLERALDLLPDGHLEFAAPGDVRPGPRGAPAAPDLVAPSLAPLNFAPGTTVAFLRAPAVNGWNAPGLAAQVGRARGLETRTVSVPFFGDIRGGHPVRVARELRELDEPPRPLRTALEEAGDADCLVVPPVVGATIEEHRDWWSDVDATARTRDVAVAEFPAARDPIFGWRLQRALGDGSQTAECTGLAAGDTGVAVESPDLDEPARFEAAALATGRFFGGGTPSSAPFVEPLTGLPIWLDGAPLPDDPAVYPPDFLGDLPWDDHELFRSGVSTDAQLRMRDRSGSPRDRLYAAGRLLAGFNPFRDGCAMGVELVTALRAADAVRSQFDRETPPPPSS